MVTLLKSEDQSESYKVTYMDSDFDSRLCNSVDLPCEEGVCYDMFHTSTSHCPNTSNITVTVSAIESDIAYSKLDPIRIGKLYYYCTKINSGNSLCTVTDAINSFVRIIITPTRLNCIFINQSEGIEKYCGITYDPVTPGCKNLTSYSESTSDSNNVEIPLDSPADGKICFVVIAGNGTKTVTVEGRSSGNQCQL